MSLSDTERHEIEALLTFWFGAPDAPEFGEPKAFWFSSTPQDDHLIQTRFETLYHKAKQGDLDHWLEDPQATLALVLLMDQVPRNIFRGTPQAFGTDALALAFSKVGIEKHYDQQLPPIHRRFLYMPFMHSEDLETQRQSLNLFAQLTHESTLDYAKAHHDIIARFQRFPHRNAILGRLSTPEEVAFLKEPNSSF